MRRSFIGYAIALAVAGLFVGPSLAASQRLASEKAVHTPRAPAVSQRKLMRLRGSKRKVHRGERERARRRRQIECGQLTEANGLKLSA